MDNRRRIDPSIRRATALRALQRDPTACIVCNGPTPIDARGTARHALYCGAACRQRHYRVRLSIDSAGDEGRI